MRCHEPGCSKAARLGTQHCTAHGGGRRCQQPGCSKPVARAPGSVLCSLCLRTSAEEQPDQREREAAETIRQLAEDFAPSSSRPKREAAEDFAGEAKPVKKSKKTT
jgi:hypothetical protein